MDTHVPCGFVRTEKLDNVGLCLLHDADAAHADKHDDRDKNYYNCRHNITPSPF